MNLAAGEVAILTGMTHASTSAPGAAYSLDHPSSRMRGTERSDARRRRLHWCLRLGAAACFIGHGAFGIITKAAWVPYFGLVGIPSDTAHALMPVVGAVDIVMGIAVLISPRPVVLLYMVVWALWTALLRPLTGESVFETLERAGNYGVPLAMLLMLGWPRSLGGWLRASDGIPVDSLTLRRLLQWTTAVLLFGHGALAAITAKPLFATHYAALGLPGTIAPYVGWLEMGVAAAALFTPLPALFIAIAAWKIATEALFPVAGAPMWEFIERAGSYAAPIGVALLAGPRPRTAGWGPTPITPNHIEGHQNDARTARARRRRERTA